ncbi:TPA: NACHT domain-containing protein [Escherichia coli]|nr:NACHT domain-containing protein [Escherichia coli]
MDPIILEITKAGAAEAVKVIVTNILSRKWNPAFIKGKTIIEQLSNTDVYSDYLVKHVSRVMKMRTIHSSETDVSLHDIYHPLHITTIGGNSPIKVDDGFVINDSDITNIIGSAGQGKSTILRKIFIETISHGNKLPFFMELRKIERLGIVKSFKRVLSEIGISASDEEITSLIMSGNIIMLLDGFDEVSSEFREQILQEIISLNITSSLQIITTSRDGTEICHESGIVNFKVNKLRKSDVVSILKKLSQSNEMEADTLKQITDILKNNSSLTDTMNSPLLVTLFYICYPHLDSIPNTATEFYSKLFNTLYFRHDKIKNFQRKRRTHLTPTEAFNCFCALCFKSIFDNRFDFTHHSLIDYVSQAIRITGCESCNAEDMANDFIDITCLIQKDGFDRYVFLHKSIQEYHAAEFVKQLAQEKKKAFMDVILDDIKKSQKFSSTARYLYEIDTDNTFNYICLKLCEEMGLDKYEEKKEEIIKNTYKDLVSDCKIVISSMKKGEATHHFISSIGPSKDNTIAVAMFMTSREQERMSPCTRALMDIIIKEHVLKEIINGDFDRTPESNIGFVDEHNNSIMDIKVKDSVSVKCSDVLSKVVADDGKTLEIKLMETLTDIIEKMYADVYKKNSEILTRKDSAISDLFNF